MSLPPNAPKLSLQTDETQLEAQVHNFHLQRIQIQNVERHSHAPSINENIESNCRNGSGQALPDSFAEGKAQSISIRGWVCAAATVLEFSILIGLILIQYISSAIHFLPLFITLLLALLLHPPLIILPHQIHKLLRRKRPLLPPLQEINSRHNASKDDSQIPTIPKINQQVVMRGNAKTKKMQFQNKEHPEEKNTQQTIKKQVETEQQPAENVENLVEGIVSRRKLVVVMKVMQVVMEVVMASLSLFIFATQAHLYRKAAVALSVGIYLLALLSSLSFLLLSNEISSILRPPAIKPLPKQRQVEVTCQQHQQPKTKISIDQIIQNKSIQRKKTFSIDKGFKRTARSQDQESVSKEKRECRSEVEAAIKMEIKRSVLKPSKILEAKSRKTTQKCPDEEMIERRKVEINSKKIQYFEYCQISPSQSVVDEDTAKVKVAAKAKLNAQRAKYMRQRMEAEARILSSKVMARQNKAKSQGCISSPNCEPPKDEDEVKIDHFL